MVEVSGLAEVAATEYPDTAPLPEIVSTRFLKENHVVGLAALDDWLEVAVADPFDVAMLDALTLACDKPVRARVGIPSEIERAIEQQMGSGKSLMGQLVDNFGGDEEIDEEDIEHLKDSGQRGPGHPHGQPDHAAGGGGARLGHPHRALRRRLKVRYRVDGMLHEVDAPPVRSTAAIISRVKIMAKLNIAERRLPQDGRIQLRVQGKELDLRVSTVPTMFGESVVMRLLDKESVRSISTRLGFDGDVLERASSQVLETAPRHPAGHRPHRQRQEHHALHRAATLNTPERKIITVEDPVEYQLDGINQIQVKPQIGLTFAGALRAIVRQDPDIIMVGEMRDLETARIAVQSALTGHVVLSTLHTNDAAGGVTRLLDMGVEDYLLTSTVNGILAQRLVRRLCPHCREPYPALPEVVEEMRLAALRQAEGEVTALQAGGLRSVRCTGLPGAAGDHGIPGDERRLRRLVMNHAQARQIEDQALKEGMDHHV